MVCVQCIQCTVCTVCTVTTIELARTELAHRTRAVVARGILPSPDPDPGRAIQQYENYYENCYENFAADDPKC